VTKINICYSTFLIRIEKGIQMSKGTSKRWPDLIDGCAKCHVPKGKAAYSRRGLCVSCENVESRAGRVKLWPKIGRDKEKHSLAAMRYTKDNYWRRKRADLIYKVVSSIGSTEAALRLDVSKEDIECWMNGGDIPAEVIDEVRSLRDKIVSLTRQANSNSREEEIFSNRGSYTRFFDGKIIG